MRIYKFIVILSVFFAANSIAADFVYQGKKIISSSQTEKTLCDGYELGIVKESFPLEYEAYVPDKYRIKGFTGSAANLSRKAYVQWDSEILLPQPYEIESIASSIAEHKTYLPGKAICGKQSFVISYWSGGNCDTCEIFVEFDIVDRRIGAARLMPYRQVLEKYAPSF